MLNGVKQALNPKQLLLFECQADSFSAPKTGEFRIPTRLAQGVNPAPRWDVRATIPPTPPRSRVTEW